MTIKKFRALGLKKLGPYWVSHFSKYINVSRRSVQRWVKGTHPIPEYAALAMQGLKKKWVLK